MYQCVQVLTGMYWYISANFVAILLNWHDSNFDLKNGIWNLIFSNLCHFTSLHDSDSMARERKEQLLSPEKESYFYKQYFERVQIGDRIFTHFSGLLAANCVCTCKGSFDFSEQILCQLRDNSMLVEFECRSWIDFIQLFFLYIVSFMF